MDDPDAVGPDDEADAKPKRGATRDSMLLQATMHHSREAASFSLRVRNLSAGGLMGECSCPFDRGDEVAVELRGLGLVPGRIAWRTEDRIGVAFDQPIDPMLARKPVTARRPADRIYARSAIESQARRPGLRIESKR